MTDLLAELERLQPLVASAKQSLALGSAVEKARKPVEQAPRHAAFLGHLVACARALDGLSEPGLRQRLEGAIDKAQDVGGALEVAATADELEAVAVDYPGVAAEIVRALDSLRTRWAQIVARDFADLPAVGELLLKISGAEAIGSDLKQIGQAAQGLADSDPQAEQLAAAAAALRARRAHTLDAMRAFTGQAEVDAFLQGVIQQRATLELVTPGVLTWLTEHGALDAFRVRS
jgi:hypothetical protein